jgi:hypothetical protein|tara:strand:- start:26 stop:214 length:189 start_codon:yes stop_codon:yes gene_type:complete
MYQLYHYNKDAVEKAIKKNYRIKSKEAKLIHALLIGHSPTKQEEKNIAHLSCRAIVKTRKGI